MCDNPKVQGQLCMAVNAGPPNQATTIYMWSTNGRNFWSCLDGRQHPSDSPIFEKQNKKKTTFLQLLTLIGRIGSSTC